MAFDDDMKLIEDYNEWKSTVTVKGKDVSPAAFVVQRAQEAAFGKLEEISTLWEVWEEARKVGDDSSEQDRKFILDVGRILGAEY